jgi:hypothetical protein
LYSYDEFKKNMIGDGNMWRVSEFKKFLLERFGADHGRAWEEKIVPQLKDIVVHTLQCAEVGLYKFECSCPAA